jgi:hypothetical protein
MNDNATVHRVTYIISVRSKYPPLGSPVFHGTLETAAGQKFEFSTLAELNGLMCEIGGWIDAPPLTNEGGEPNPSSRSKETNSSGGNN